MLTIPDLIRQRLFNLQIAETEFSKPEELVSHLCAMQSQDWNMAKWAIGMRLPGSKESDIDKAFNEGKILRTHVMRPTWHFVSPEDIRWLQQLTGPRVNTFNATYYRKHELDDKIFKRSAEIFTKALQGNNFLTRTELAEELVKKKINTDELRLMLMVMKAELDGLICSGPRVEKHFTYALIEERVPKAKTYSREEALGMLTKKYFCTRGPATLKDFVWWSGLTVKESKEGVAMLKSEFVKEKIDQTEYLFIPNKNKITAKQQTTFLLPEYDEYGISYKDRSAVLPKTSGVPTNKHIIILDGIAGGTWQKQVKGKNTIIETSFYKKLSAVKTAEVEKAVKRYHNFIS